MVNTVLSIDVNTLSDLITEIDKTARQKQDDLVLTSVSLTFKGKDECLQKEGMIEFGYSAAHKKRDRVSKMHIFFNMKGMTIEKYNWEKGVGKRVGNNTTAIDKKYLEYSVTELFACFDQDDKYLAEVKNINPNLRIILQLDRLDVYLFDMDSENSDCVFKYSIDGG
jgi:hypothetical protein